MKNLIFILLLLPSFIWAQTAKEPGLFEVVHLKVKKGKEKDFEAAVKKHNLEFHKKGTPHNAALFYLINGPDGGKYSWIMGPTNFTAMDSRPSDDAHDSDWAIVSQYVESASSPTYWSVAKELSSAGTNAGGKKSLVWLYDLKHEKSQRWKELVSQVTEVYKTKRPEESFFVYWNNFADTKAGRDAAVVFPFEKWAWLDRESNFSADFEEVHGKGTWTYFLDEFSECVNGRVDVLRERID